MDLQSEIKELIRYLNQKSKSEREIANKTQSSFTRGLNIGYSSAYELCADWLKEILPD